MIALRRLASLALGAGSLLAIALLAGRLSGLARELVLAARFGTSAQADVAVVMLTLPDLLVNLLLSGGLSAALIPRLRALPPEDAARLFRFACGWAVILFGLIAAIIALWPPGVFALFAPGLAAPGEWIDRGAMTLLALSVPLTALAGITAAYLNSGDRFFIAGLGTLIFNLVVIGALLAWPGAGLAALGSAILAGAALRLVSQASILPKPTWRLTDGAARRDPQFLAAFGAGIAAASFTLAPPALIRAAASLLGTGNIAAFNYSQKLVELPVGILITTISTIALPKLSGLYGSGDTAAAGRLLHERLQQALILAMMVTLFGVAFAEPVASIIFLRGAIDADDVGQIARLTRVVLLGVPFLAIGSMAAAALNAQLRTTRVLRATGWSILALAIFAAPGLATSSDLLLMGAVVGSQVVLAALLASRAGICLGGPEGIAGRQALMAFGAGGCVALPFILAGTLVDFGYDVLVVGVGAVGFVAATGAAIAVSRR